MGCINCFDKFILLIWLPICTALIAKCEASEHRRAQSIIKQQEARNAEQHQMIDVVLGYHRISHCSSRCKLVSQHCFCKRDRACRGLGIYCASTITNRVLSDKRTQASVLGCRSFSIRSAMNATR